MMKRMTMTAALAVAVLMAAPAIANEGQGDEVGFFDPTTGIWSMPGQEPFYFGDPGDKPMSCDWDGDGLASVGQYRDTTGFLYLSNDNATGFADTSIFYGVPGDMPVCGDWNGDGVETIGIYRSSENLFYLRNSNTQGVADVVYAIGAWNGGIPFAGDFDGDGIDTVGVLDPNTGYYQLGLPDGGFHTEGYFGTGADYLIFGDWDGDGDDDFGVYRPEISAFLLSTHDGTAELILEAPADGRLPITGNWIGEAGLRSFGGSLPIEPRPQPVPTPNPAPPSDWVPASPDESADSGLEVPTGGIQARPGDDLNSLVRNAGAGATIVLSPGTYYGQTIEPLSNQTIVGPGAVLDGRGAEFAVRGRDGASNVRLVGFEVKNYSPGKHHGAIDFRSTEYHGAGFGPQTNWILEDLNVHHNYGDGVFVGDGGRLYNVVSTDNHWLGFGAHGRNIGIFGGEVARNSQSLGDHDVNDHAGGMKFVKVEDVVVSGLYSHDNGGPGIWFDITARDVIIENSLATDNQRNGIFYEISYDAVIRNNTVLRNGWGDPDFVSGDPWLWGSGILIGTSRNVTVEDNYIADSAGGIAIHDMPHRQGERYDVQAWYRDGRDYAGVDNVVRGNTIVNSGRTGAAAGGNDAWSAAAFDRNTFEDNEYLGGEFWWRNSGGRLYGESYSWSRWQSAGNDLGGQVLSVAPGVPSRP